MTSGSDAQRSSWVRADPKISNQSMAKPGFEFLWKVKLASDSKLSHALTPPVLLDRYIGYRGFRTLGFLAAGPDDIYALDIDLGRVEWRKRLALAASPAGCAEFSVNLARPTTVAFPPAGAGGQGGGLGGRGGPAHGAVGQPLEGAVTIAQVAAASRGTPDPPGGPGTPRRGAAGRGGPPPGFGRTPTVVHVLSSDGMLHTMYVSNGEEPQPPVRLVPPSVKASGLIVLEDTAYAATAQGCGSAENAVWSVDLASKQVANWRSSAKLSGSQGPAIAPDGTLYVSTDGGDLVALEPKTLRVKSTYSGGKPGFTSSPVIFEYKQRILLAAATSDGRIHLLDAAAMGGTGHQTPLYKTSSAASPATGALASWQDSAGTRWVLAPAAAAVVA